MENPAGQKSKEKKKATATSLRTISGDDGVPWQGPKTRRGVAQGAAQGEEGKR